MNTLRPRKGRFPNAWNSLPGLVKKLDFHTGRGDFRHETKFELMGVKIPVKGLSTRDLLGRLGHGIIGKIEDKWNSLSRRVIGEPASPPAWVRMDIVASRCSRNIMNSFTAVTDGSRTKPTGTVM